MLKKVFLDTEFTGLHQQTNLISIALVAETGEEFYAEFTDYDKGQVNKWIRDHVIKLLNYNDVNVYRSKTENSLKIKGNRATIKAELQTWFEQFHSVEIWADVLAYDWVLFCELFGGASSIPENIFYAPFDLATAFREKRMIKPEYIYNEKEDDFVWIGDVQRFDFVNQDANTQHHALNDARAELACYQKLMSDDN